MRDKLIKFAAVHDLPNVKEFPRDDFAIEIKKHQDKYSGIILELGCGRGAYTLGLAKLFPDKLIIGVDIQGERIWYGAQEALSENLTNVLFFRFPIDKIDDLIPSNSIDELWITFPDPYPKDRHEKHRLTGKKFLTKYKKILKPNNFVHLKTDNPPLFDFSLQEIKNFGGKILLKNENVQHLPDSEKPEEKILTHFEKKHRAKGRNIFYVKFAL